MRLGKFTFQPTLLPSLVTLLVLPLLLALGFWQLDRAHQKEVLQGSFKAALQAPEVPITNVDLANPALRYRRVTLRGRYDGRHQILLDNQVQDGQPGYHVFTPLQIPGKTSAILINRGWVPLGSSRQTLPDLAVTGKEVVISGRISQPANPGLRLGSLALDSAGRWPQVVQYLDYDELAAALGYPVEPAVVLLDPGVTGGYLRKWQSQFVGFGPERHRGYAVQWFSLAIALIVIYIIVNTRRYRAEDRQSI
jgi:surfeit locus 1 family protein